MSWWCFGVATDLADDASKIRSRTAIASRSLVVAAATPDAATSSAFRPDGNALSGIPFGGDSQKQSNSATSDGWSQQ